MQYNININQLAVSKHFPSIDLKDAAIIDFIMKFGHSLAAKRFRIIEGGHDFFWFSYSKLVYEMPLLKISSERVMKRRFDKLVKCGILIRHPKCRQLNKSYFAFSDKIELLLSGASTGETYTPKSVEVSKTYTPKSVEVSKETYTPKSVENHSTSTTNGINHLTNNHLTKSGEAESSAPFSDSDLKDFEAQIEAGAPAISIPADDDGGAKPKGKTGDNSKKEISPKILARRVWDKNYRAWMLKRKGVVAEENDGIYWNPVEIGQLSNFLKALTNKAKGKGKEYTDRQVVEIALNDFLDAAANLDVWYLSAFTPTNLYKNFNTLYCDVLNFITNGKSNDSRRARNGHGISQAARAATVAMLD
jgi:hypothetical protein